MKAIISLLLFCTFFFSFSLIPSVFPKCSRTQALSFSHHSFRQVAPALVNHHGEKEAKITGISPYPSLCWLGVFWEGLWMYFLVYSLDCFLSLTAFKWKFKRGFGWARECTRLKRWFNLQCCLRLSTSASKSSAWVSTLQRKHKIERPGAPKVHLSTFDLINCISIFHVNLKRISSSKYFETLFY